MGREVWVVYVLNAGYVCSGEILYMCDLQILLIDHDLNTGKKNPYKRTQIIIIEKKNLFL